MFVRPGFIHSKQKQQEIILPDHSAYAAGSVHMPFNWVVADAAARTALSVTAADVYKACWQIDTSAIYILVDDSPVTWAAISGGSGGTPQFTHVYRNANQAYALGWNTIQFNAADKNPNSYFNTTNWRFTPAPGVYLIKFTVSFTAAVGAPDIQIAIWKNGSFWRTAQRNNNNIYSFSFVSVEELNGTDYLEARVYSETAFTVVGTTAQTYFQAVKLEAGGAGSSDTTYDPYSRWIESLVDVTDQTVGSAVGIPDAIGANTWTPSSATIVNSDGYNWLSSSVAAEQVARGPESILRGDFTIEGFVKLAALSHNLVAVGADGSNRFFVVSNASGQLFVDRQAITNYTFTGPTFALNTIAHWHLSRRAGVLFGGINGVGTSTAAFIGDTGTATNTIRISTSTNARHRHVRYTVGRSRYASGNYTVPTIPYSDIAP